MKLATKVDWSTPERKWSDSAIEDTERYRDVDTGKEKFMHSFNSSICVTLCTAKHVYWVTIIL